MTCPYCGENKPQQEFTDEHVLPKALGGNLRPNNPFKLSVCKRCNTICGLYVDGPFIKCWFIHNERAIASMQYLDPEGGPPLPLIYMGPLESWNGDGVCDFWLGPTGDHIYHFHEPYPTEPILVGKPPHIKKEQLDPGCVMINIVATNPEWHPIIIRSIESEFAASDRYYLNVACKEGGPPYPPIPEKHDKKLQWINAFKPGEMRHAHLSIDINSGLRFSIKLALGMGCLFLDESFISSSDAAKLREGLWTTDRSKVSKLQIHGSTFLTMPDDRFCNVLNWHECHIIILKPNENSLGLSLCINGKHASVIEVTSNPSHWQGIISEEGLVWVVSPQLRRFAGPITLPRFIYQKGLESPEGELGELYERILSASPMPLFHS